MKMYSFPLQTDFGKTLECCKLWFKVFLCHFVLKDRDLLHYAFRFNRQQLKSGKVTAGCSNLIQSVTDNGGGGGWGGGGGGVVGWCEVSCILRHQGVKLMLAYSWARPAILVAGKGREGNVLFLLFLHSCSSFFRVPLFHLYYLFYLFSSFLWETT